IFVQNTSKTRWGKTKVGARRRWMGWVPAATLQSPTSPRPSPPPGAEREQGTGQIRVLGDDAAVGQVQLAVAALGEPRFMGDQQQTGAEPRMLLEQAIDDDASGRAVEV